MTILGFEDIHQNAIFDEVFISNIKGMQQFVLIKKIDSHIVV